ncbi:MAG: prepilin-type N-terminal cleavage/methylation domain-containing protein [Candidatus Paceibacterota bacterium]|jgi:prepilin-type N-terminal cleavage/methylation domain-containing protein
MKIENLKIDNKGFSLAEVVVVVAIASIIFMGVFNLGQSIFSFNSTAQKNLSAQSDGRRVLKSIVKELRSASQGSLGSYPIVLAGTSTLTFFVNLDSDSYKEQVRYFLSGTELKRGVTKPSGTPLSYNSVNEQVITLVRDINNGSTAIFEYFDSTYAGTSTPMIQPVQITKIRLIGVTIKIEKDPNKSVGPVIVTSQVFLRNLKDNL